MKRIKSAPANIAEMVNRKKPDTISKKTIFIVDNTNDNTNDNRNDKKLKDMRSLNSYTERTTNVINDVLDDILSLSFEETAFLGIILNLLNNTFRKDKLRDFSAIIIQSAAKYIIMIYLHNYVLNDYIEEGTKKIIHYIN